VAESGSLKGGVIRQTNVTNNTMTGQYLITMDNQEDI